MPDPTIVGAAVATGGAVLGYVGTITTGWLTRRRDDRDWAFKEKRTAYGAAMRTYRRTRDDIRKLADTRGTTPSQDALDESVELMNEAQDLVDLLAPRAIRKQFAAARAELVNSIKDEREKREAGLTKAQTESAKLVELTGNDLGVGSD